MAWSEKAIDHATAELRDIFLSGQLTGNEAALRIAAKSALDAAAAVDGDAGWRPIETAPLDTDVILAWHEKWPVPMWKQAIGWAGKSNSCAKESGYSDAWFHGTATHWKPLSPPPSAH